MHIHTPTKILIVSDLPGTRQEINRWLHHHFEGMPHLICETNYEGFWFSKEEIHPNLIILSHDISIVKISDIVIEMRIKEDERRTSVIVVGNSENALRPSISDVEASLILENGVDDIIEIYSHPRESRSRLMNLVKLKNMYDRLRLTNFRLRRQTITDELTGLANMRGFNFQITKSFQKCKKGQTGLAVVMFDLDYLKKLNDSTHHLVGSYAISQIGKIFKQIFPPSKDLFIARYGGDEFVMIWETDQFDWVMMLAEEFRQTVEKTAFIYEGIKFTLSLSIGVSLIKPNFQGKLKDVIKASDYMLYRSKEKGRNQIHHIYLDEKFQVETLAHSHLGTHFGKKVVG